MLDKLRKIQKEFETLTEKLSDPNLAKDPKEFARVAKKRSVLEPTVELTVTYDACLKTIEDSENMLKNEKDPELLELAKL